MYTWNKEMQLLHIHQAFDGFPSVPVSLCLTRQLSCALPARLDGIGAPACELMTCAHPVPCAPASVATTGGLPLL